MTKKKPSTHSTKPHTRGRKRGSKFSKLQKISRKKQDEFLIAFAKSGNILHAAEQVGIDRGTHYDWLRKPEYAARYAVAEQDALEVLEREAIRRGLVGYDEPVFGNKRGPAGENLGTQQIGNVRKFSDTLLMFVLKARAPARYREHFSHEHTGQGGGPQRVELIVKYEKAQASDEENGG